MHVKSVLKSDDLSIFDLKSVKAWSIELGKAFPKLASFLTSPATIATTGVAISAASIAYLAYLKSFDAAIDNVNKRNEELAKTQGEINTLENERKGVLEDIAQLESLSDRTVAQEAELTNLKQKNDLLEVQLEIQRNIRDIQAEASKNAAREALTSPTNSWWDNASELLMAFTSGKSGQVYVPSFDNKGTIVEETKELQNTLASYNAEKSQISTWLENTRKNHDAFPWLDSEDDYNNLIEEYVSKIQDYDAKILKIKSDITNNESTITSLYKSLLGTDGEISKEDRELADSILEVLPTLNKDRYIDNIFSKRSGGGEAEKAWYDALTGEQKDIVFNLIVNEDAAEFTIEQFQEKIDIIEKQAEDAAKNVDKEIGKDVEKKLIISTEFMEKESGRVDSLKNYISESLGATGLSAKSMQEIADLYSTIEGYDISNLFARSELGIRLNSDALSELDSKYQDLRKNEIADQLKNLRKEYDKTAKSLKNLTNDEVKYKAATDRMADLKTQIEQTKNLENQFESLSNAYNKWVIAQGITSGSEKFENIGSAYESMKAIYEAGWKGDKSLNAYLDLMLGSNRSQNVDEAWVALSNPAASGITNKLLDYYTKDASGNVNTSGLYKFLGDVNTLLGDSFAVYDKELKQWKFDFSGYKLSRVAGALNTSEEYINTLIDSLERAGFSVTRQNEVGDFGEPEDGGLGESATALTDAASAHTAAADALVGAAGAIISAVSGEKNGASVPSAGALAGAIANGDAINGVGAAGAIISAVEFMRAFSTAPDRNEKVGNHLSIVDDNNIGIKPRNDSIREKLAESGVIPDAVDLPLDVKPVIQTNEDIPQEVSDALESMSDKEKLFGRSDGAFVQKIVPEFFIDPQTIAEQIQSDIGEIKQPEIGVSFAKDSVAEFTAAAQEEVGLFKTYLEGMASNGSAEFARRVLSDVKTKQNTIFGKDTPLIDSLLSMTNDALMGQINSWQKEYVGQDYSIDSQFTIPEELIPKVPVEGELTQVDISNAPDTTIPATANIVGTTGIGHITLSATANVTKTSGLASGFAKASGNAFAGGTIGAKDSGVALGGELDEELIVRGNRYFTVGKNGAEFFKYRKGDIIFNAEQTKQLLKNGAISRGKVRGTAFAAGTLLDQKGEKLIYGAASSVLGKAGNALVGAAIGAAINGTKNIVIGVGPGLNDSAKTPSYSGGGGGGSPSTSGTEKIDWIEVSINRIERAVKKFTDTVSNAFMTLGKRSSAVGSAIDKINSEIEIQLAAEKRYLEEAEKVELASDLKELVRDGKIDIEGYNKETKEKIEEYRQWYEKSLASGEAVTDLHKQIAQLYQDSFNMAQADAENKISQIDHAVSRIESRIDAITEGGYMSGTSLYADLIDIENQRAAMLKKEYSELENRLKSALNSGEIEEGSEAFYDMQNAINDVSESIDDSNMAMIKYSNTIREIEWERFDYAQEKISATVDETEFLISLLEKSKLFDDNGIMNENGVATIGLYAQKFNTYMAQADAYANEMAAINRDLSKDPYNTTLIKRREELLKLQQQSILSAEKEKEAISGLVEDGIKEQLSALKDLISEYKDSIDSAKDLYEYQKNINKQTQKIADIEKQIAAYSGNDSEEARAKLQKLRNDLTEAQSNLQDTEYDKYISDQKDMLDELYTEYEEALNARLDDTNALIMDMIDMVNNSSIDIRDTLNSVSSEVGYTMTSNMESFWNTMNNSFSETVSKYGADFSTKINGTNNLLEGIYFQIADMVGYSEGLSSGLYSGGNVALTGINGVASHALDFGGYGNGGVSIDNVNITIPIDHVDDYDDFVTKMRDDKQFERFIQSITTNVATGGSSLSKYGYSWK